jgi:hypothetical protein
VTRSLLALSALVTSATLAAGCGTMETHAAMFREAQPSAGRVDIYMVTQSVDRPYYEIALVEAIGSGDRMDAEHLVAALRAKAQSVGCNGVIRVQIDVGYTRAHAAGVCVRFSPDSVPPVLDSALRGDAP